MPEQKQNQPQWETGTEKRAATGTGEATVTTTEEDQAAVSNKPKISSLHTLKGDLSEYIKERDISLSEIVAQNARQRYINEEPGRSKRFFILTAISILIIAGLGFGGWYVFLRGNPAIQENTLQTPKPIIVSEKQEIITLASEKRSELVSAIQQKMDSPIAIGTVLDIPVLIETADKKEFLKTESFFNILGITPPANITQALEGSFGLGIYYLKKNVPFLVLKIRSLDIATAGMFEWEKNLSSDLTPVLLIKNKALIGEKFRDGVIKNHDIRILYDASNNPVIAYIFINSGNLLITTDLDTITEIFSRFSL